MKYRNNHYGVSRIFRRARCKIPMDIQFFADGGEAGGEGGAGGAGGGAAGDGGAAGGEGAGTGGAGNSAGGEGGSGMSFDDFLKDPRQQAEFDRRVAKALNTSKTKWEQEMEARQQEAQTEAEKMAKMNAEQRAQYQRQKKEEDLTKREREITRRELMATAKEQLAEKGMPTSLASVLNYESAEECTASIDAVSKAFQEAVQQAVDSRLAGGKPPKKADDKPAYTMEQIRAMSPEQINKNWDAVQAAMKAAK